MSNLLPQNSIPCPTGGKRSQTAAYLAVLLAAIEINKATSFHLFTKVGIAAGHHPFLVDMANIFFHGFLGVFKADGI